MISLRPFASIAPLLALSACASTGDYPSLAIRDAERQQGTFTPDTAQAAPAPPPAPSADLAGRLAQLSRQAADAHAEFQRAAPAARRAAAAAGATGSDSWASAQVALADLDTLRSRAAVPLADLDALWADSQVSEQPQPAIAETRAAIETLIAEEDRTLAELRGRVRS